MYTDIRIYLHTLLEGFARIAGFCCAQAGRDQRKKDLGAMAMAYQHVYVASVAIGANYKQTVEAFAEAEKYETWRFKMKVLAITYNINICILY